MTHFHRTGQSLRRLRADRAGATAIEYAMIAALIALAIFSSIGKVGDSTAALIERSGDAVRTGGDVD